MDKQTIRYGKRPADWTFGYNFFINTNFKENGKTRMRFELWKTTKEEPAPHFYEYRKVDREIHPESEECEKKFFNALVQVGIPCTFDYYIMFSSMEALGAVYQFFSDYGWHPFVDVMGQENDFATPHGVHIFYDSKEAALNDFHNMIDKLKTYNFRNLRGHFLVDDILGERSKISIPSFHEWTFLNEGIFTLRVGEVRRVVKFIETLPGYKPASDVPLSAEEIEYYTKKNNFVFPFRYNDKIWYLYVDRSTMGRPFYKLEQIKSTGEMHNPENSTEESTNPCDVLLTTQFADWDLAKFVDRKKLQLYVDGQISIHEVLYKKRGEILSTSLGLDERVRKISETSDK